MKKLSDDPQVYITLFTSLPLSLSLSLSPLRGMMGTFVTLLSLQLKNRPLSLLEPKNWYFLKLDVSLVLPCENLCQTFKAKRIINI